MQGEASNLRIDVSPPNQFMAIVEASDDAIVSTTIDGLVVTWNRGTERLYGYTADEMIGRSLAIVMRPDRPAELSGLLNHVRRGERVQHYETFHLRRDGSQVQVSLSVAPLQGPGGRVTGAALIARDVTARKLAESAQIGLLEHAERAEERFRGLLEAAPDAVVLANQQGRIELVNREMERLFGYDRSELIGHPVEMLLPERFHEMHVNHRSAYNRAPRKRPMGMGLELYARRKDGSEFPVEVSLSPMRTDDEAFVIAVVRDTTERKLAEEDQARLLRRAELLEQRFRSMLDSAPDAVAIAGSDGRIVLVNRQVERLFGYGRAELLGQPVEVLIPERFHQVHVADRTGYVVEPHTRPMGAGLDLFARRKDGSEFPVEISLSPLETEEGMLVTSIIRDITERKHAEMEQRFLANASAALGSSLDYDATLQAVAHLAIPFLADDCVVDLWDEPGALRRVMSVSGDATREVTARELAERYPLQRTHSNPIWDVLDHERPRVLAEIPQQVLLDAAQDRRHLELLQQLQPQSALIVPLLVHSRSLGAITFLYTVSGRRFGERDLPLAEELARRCALAIDNARSHIAEQHARAEAEAQRAQLAAILEATPDGIFYVQAGNLRVTANPRASELVGRLLTPEEGLADYASVMSYPDGEPVAAENLAPYRALRGESIAGEERTIRRADGAQIPVVVHAAPVYGPKGDILGAVVALQDVTALKDLERLREEWTSVIAHDLRQPIAAISAYASAIEVLTNDHPELGKANLTAENILLSSQQLDRMINDLLDVSRLAAGRLQLQPIRLELPLFLPGVIQRMTEQLNGHAVEISIADRSPHPYADPGRVEQVLVNLLSNAAKYGERGAQIRIEVQPGAEVVELAVINHGPGIAVEDLPNLFARFYRTREAQRSTTAGLGLGLYISREIVRAHGGRMWVESVPGATTSFRFTLPPAP